MWQKTLSILVLFATRSYGQIMQASRGTLRHHIWILGGQLHVAVVCWDENLPPMTLLDHVQSNSFLDNLSPLLIAEILED
jgi:hypothetical protein